jgi:hypothetical protein
MFRRSFWPLSIQTPLMPNICYPYIHLRMKLVYAAAALGFLVPYFDLDVILLPTPPYVLLAVHTSVKGHYVPNPALL